MPTASGQPLIADVNAAGHRGALDTAARIGDDYIQSNLGGGRVDQSQFTHGSSAQREKWYTTGYQTGDPAQLRHVRPRRRPRLSLPREQGAALAPSSRHPRPTSSVHGGRTKASAASTTQPDVLGATAPPRDGLGAVAPVAQPLRDP